MADDNLCYTENSRKYLLAEGVRKDHVFSVGSPPCWRYLVNLNKKLKKAILNTLKVKSQKYIVASIHREENLDLKDNFINIIETIEEVANNYLLPVYFTLHPTHKEKIRILKYCYIKKYILLNQ